jgi:NADH-quinone oxidoreductase subunit J
VLFLFVVMMLDIKQEAVREGFMRYLPVGVVVAVVMLVEMLAMIGVKAMHAHTLGPNPAGSSNVAWLGQALYTEFLLPFEIAALILTVGVVAAVALTLRQRLGVRHQSAAQQVAVKATDRVRVVKVPSETMASVRPAPAPVVDPTQENAQ